MKIETIDIKDIRPDENQPRKYFSAEKLNLLSESIKKYGIKEPLMVEKIGDKYLLIDGERRFKVANQLKLKVVPCIVEPTSSAIDRLVKQFHIQEQREGWTAIEKATALTKLSKELGLPLAQACEMLGIPKRTAQQYLAFGSLINKDLFQRTEIPLEYASAITGLRKSVKKLFVANDDILDRQDEKALEETIIAKIKNGRIQNVREIGKLKDSFTKDIKSMYRFIKDGNITAEELFVKTKAKGAYALRKVDYYCGYMLTAILDLHKNNDVSMPETTKVRLRLVQKHIKELIDLVD